MSSKKPTIVLISTLVIALAITIWGIFFNQATINVTSELTPFKITLGEEITDCPSSPCSITVSPRRYQISIAKGGYSAQTQEINLDRGDKLQIDYTGFALPRIKPVELAESIPQGYLSLNNTGDQVLYIRTPDQGDIVVTTFRDPLQDPVLRVSPERDYALVWDQEVYPPEYFMVDIPFKTKKNFEFPTNNLPSDLKFLDDQNLLLLRDNQVHLFNIETGQSSFFPVQNLDQIQPISNHQTLIVSSQDLDQFNPTSNQAISFEDILSISEDDVNIEEDNSLPGKLYYYIDGAYTLLFELQDELQPPYRFFETQIENQTEIILQSNDNLHLIKTEL
jgi:hypothetical protein